MLLQNGYIMVSYFEANGLCIHFPSEIFLTKSSNNFHRSCDRRETTKKECNVKLLTIWVPANQEIKIALDVFREERSLTLLLRTVMKSLP